MTVFYSLTFLINSFVEMGGDIFFLSFYSILIPVVQGDILKYIF